MNETNEKNSKPEASLDTNKASTPVQDKKSSFKLYVFLLLVLTVGAWSFWTYSPIVSSFKEATLNQHLVETIAPVAPIAATSQQPSLTKQQPTVNLLESPTFEPTTALDQGITLEEDTMLNPQDQPTQDLAATSATLQELQQQISALNQDILMMQQQQVQYQQAQIRAQLFAMLRQAGSAQQTLDDNIVAWKSITFMPMISGDKKTFSQQAYATLHNLQNEIQYTQHEITTWIATLSSQLQPHEQAAVATMHSNIDPYQQTTDNTPISWLDWLQQQFKISKAHHPVVISDDPYAKLKTLLVSLHHLQQNIQAEQWGKVGNLNTLFYQLEQYGIQTDLSTETIKSLGSIQHDWQTQAQIWMEQL